MGKDKIEQAEQNMRNFLETLGVHLAEHGMEETPRNVAELFAQLLSGIGQDVNTLWGKTFDAQARGLVAVCGIPFCSICEHHLVPFFGTVNIVYLPNHGRVAGFGRFSRVVTCLSHRPQLQERLTQEIADSIMKGLAARGAFVLLEAQQLCMLLRGKASLETRTLTSEARGILTKDPTLMAQATAMITKSMRTGETHVS